MSGKLLALKKAIKGTKTTRKMTKAMELVASSKMKQFQNKANSSINFSSNVSHIIKQGLEEEYYNDSIFLRYRNSGKNLIILYSSDKGLCGTMNTRIFRTLKSSDVFNSNSLYIVIGRKGRKFAKNNNLKVIDYFGDLLDSTTDIDIINIVDSVIKVWKEEDISNVYMVKPNFKSTLAFYPNVSKLLPLKIELLQDLPKSTEINVDFNYLYKLEPTKSLVFDKALETYIVSNFYSAFLDLKAVEYSTRMIAMQNATKAADERIDDLTLDYNKARQAAITQEITEIINGGEIEED